jgi:hypothetical protein
MDDSENKLIAAIERAEREVARLARDTEKLFERIKDTNTKERYPSLEMPAVGGPRRTVHERTSEGRIEELRDSVKASEYHLSAIRAMLDDTEKLVIAGLLKKK